MKILTPVIIVAIGSLLVGCQTQATSERFTAAQKNTLTCQQKVLEYKANMAKQKVVFKNEQNALVYMVVQELAKSKSSDDLATCDDLYVAMINADSKKVSGLINGGVRLGGLGLGLWGVSILTNGITDIANQPTGGNWTVNNSRVVSGSGNGATQSTISASGTGLGQQNNIGNTGNSQGGLLPRQINDASAQADVSVSGDDALEQIPETMPAPEI